MHSTDTSSRNISNVLLLLMIRDSPPPFPRKRGKNNHCVSTIWCKLYHTVFLKNKSDVYVYNYIPVRFTSHLNRFIIKQFVVIFMCISANGNNFFFSFCFKFKRNMEWSVSKNSLGVIENSEYNTQSVEH